MQLTFHSSAGAGNNAEQSGRFYWGHGARKWETGGQNNNPQRQRGGLCKELNAEKATGGGLRLTSHLLRSAFTLELENAASSPAGGQEWKKPTNVRRVHGVYSFLQSFCCNIACFLRLHASVTASYLLSPGLRRADVTMKKKKKQTRQPHELFPVKLLHRRTRSEWD